MKVLNQCQSSDFKYIGGRCPSCGNTVSTYDDLLKCSSCGEKLQWKKWKGYELVDESEEEE